MKTYVNLMFMFM